MVWTKVTDKTLMGLQCDLINVRPDCISETENSKKVSGKDGKAVKCIFKSFVMMKRCLSYILCKYMRYSLNETTSDVADEFILCQITCNRSSPESA